MKPDDFVLRLLEVFSDKNASSVVNIREFNHAKKINVYTSDSYDVIVTLHGYVDNENSHNYTVFFKNDYTTYNCRINAKIYEQKHYWIDNKDSDILQYLFSLMTFLNGTENSV